MAADPTPRDALALRLMQRDGSPSLYLGRPCHFIADDPHCAPPPQSINALDGGTP